MMDDDSALLSAADAPCTSIEQATYLLRLALRSEGHFLDGTADPGMPRHFQAAERIYNTVLSFLDSPEFK